MIQAVMSAAMAVVSAACPSKEQNFEFWDLYSGTICFISRTVSGTFTSRESSSSRLTTRQASW